MLGAYSSSLSLACAFLFKSDVETFTESLIEDVSLLVVNNTKADFIPPIVYNEMGKCFNVDYNFMVDSLSNLHGEIGIKNDFSITEGMDSAARKNAMFLVVGILEQYYGLVRNNKNYLDITKFKKMEKKDISQVFHNVVCIKNGKNVRRFLAVPFSASVVKSLVSEESFNSLMKVAKSDSFEQVVFGSYMYEKYIIEFVKPAPVWP
jgi:hypothetical protein